MHLAICDDSAYEIAIISKMLETYSINNKVIITYETFNSATELLETMGQRSFDLLLLDILMPGVTGMEAAQEIRQSNNKTPIIFLTSSAEFAIKSYSVDAENYIMKPATEEEFFLALDKIFSKILRHDFITLKTTESIIKLPFAEIEYVEVMNRKVKFNLIGNRTEAIYGYLVDYEKDLLSCPGFFKPHRSYIVNFQHVSSLNKSGFTTVFSNFIPVARGLFVQAKTAYMKYLLSGKGDI